MSEKIKPENIFEYSLGNTTIERIFLSDKFKTLRPQTYLNDLEKSRYILCYFPSKNKIKNRKYEEKNFTNTACFVVYKPRLVSPIKKFLLPFGSPDLVENFSIDVLPTWRESRWDLTDFNKWRNESTLTEPKQVYNLLINAIKKYLEFPDKFDYTYCALWIIGTYFYNIFDAYPYNDVTGIKRAGKTKVLELQKYLCYNAIMSPDMSGSSLFRTIQGTGATILLDETEQFGNKNNENAQHVRTLLNQGFLKGQFVTRSDSKEKGFTTNFYDIYCPKSLAHINSFDDVLEDRCIALFMKRTENDKIKNAWIDSDDPTFQQIRNLCYRLFLDYVDEVFSLVNEAKKLLDVNSRELQIWTPIITLALFFEKHGLTGVVKAIQDKVESSSRNRQIDDEQENESYKIIEFVTRFGINEAVEFKNNPRGWISVKGLYELLKTNSDQIGINPDYLTDRQLSQTLRRLGFNRAKKQEGISYLITVKTVNEIRAKLSMELIPETESSTLFPFSA